MSQIFKLLAALRGLIFGLGRILRPQRAPQPLKQAVPASIRQVTQPATPMSADAHWARVSAVIQQSASRAQGMSDRHLAARQQLDAAEYTLQQLIDDLNVVMRLPVTVQPVRLMPASNHDYVQALAA
jgi:hypothetical protein